jgi:hypothetical protein
MKGSPVRIRASAPAEGSIEPNLALSRERAYPSWAASGAVRPRKEGSLTGPAGDVTRQRRGLPAERK